MTILLELDENHRLLFSDCKIHGEFMVQFTVILYSTSSSVIAERPRCRVDFGQKWKTGTAIQYFADITGLSSTTLR